MTTAQTSGAGTGAGAAGEAPNGAPPAGGAGGAAGTGAGTGAGTQAGTPPPAQEVKTAATPPPAAGKPPEEKKPEGGAETKPRSLKDDEEPGDSDKEITISSEGLRKRIERGARKFIKEKFGLDEKGLEEKLTTLTRHEQEQEEKRKAQLTREEQLQEDLKLEKQKRERLENQLKDQEEARLVSEQEGEFRKIADKHVDAKYWKFASREFAEHLTKKHGAALETVEITEADVEKFFGDWAKDNPGMAAKPAEEKKVEAEKDGGKDAKREPLRNGTANGLGKKTAPLPTGKLAGKTLAPGKPNSMTDAEVREYKRANSLKW